MAVDVNTVKRIARLARIRVPEAQLVPMAAELNTILKWIEQLGEIDTSAVEPMTTPVRLKLKMREDVVTDGGTADDVVRNAPGREEDFFTVPKVVE
jgi:aspartyl-tRNA(Asn)/glutamyl-tRNA(Gln) amidotransferase subunit C